MNYSLSKQGNVNLSVCCQIILGMSLSTDILFYEMMTTIAVSDINFEKQLIKEQPEKNSGLNEIQTHDFCDTSAAL